MKHWMAMAVVAASLAAPVWAHGDAAHGHSHDKASNTPTANAANVDAHTREDIERHEAMARAHAQAAQCLASGGAHGECQKQLQTACKGLALGKNCGMRHAH